MAIFGYENAAKMILFEIYMKNFMVILDQKWTYTKMTKTVKIEYFLSGKGIPKSNSLTKVACGTVMTPQLWGFLALQSHWTI